jgi:GNAT superfamily N-acetyltransferase
MIKGLKYGRKKHMQLTNISLDNITAFSPLMTAEAIHSITKGRLGAVGAILDNTACGILVYELCHQEVLMIHEIAVSTPFRRQGVGTTLLNYMKDLALDNALLLFCTFPEQEGSVQQLFQTCHFHVTPIESFTYSITMEELKEPSALDHFSPHVQIEQLSALPHHIWNRFRSTQAEKGLRFLSWCEERKTAWESTLCLCVLNGIEVGACVIIERHESGDYQLSYAYASADESNHLAFLLAAARKRLLTIASADSSLYITAVNQSSRKLIGKLLPGAQRVEQYSKAMFGADEASLTVGGA